MLRVKGSFRNGRKKGARPNLHNFRSSSNGIKWNDQIAIEVAEKVEATKMPISAPVVLEDKEKSDGDLMGEKNWRDYVSDSLKHPQGMETESSKKK